MRLKITVALATALLVLIAEQSRAAILYSTTGSTYSQNFDSLPNTPQNASLGASPAGWTDDNAAPGAGNFSIPGWYLYHSVAATEGGFNSHQRMRIGAGTANTGGFMSFGASGSTERALGDVGSTTIAANPGPVYSGVRLTNGTLETLTTLTIQYTGEQWRHGNNAAGIEKIFVAASVEATTNVTNWADQTTTNPDFVTVWPLTFSSLTGGTNDVALDGNLAANRGTLSATFSLGWAPGTDLWIRFNEPQVLGNDDGLAIDDFSFTADVPEPSSLILLVAAIFGLALAKRR